MKRTLLLAALTGALVLGTATQASADVDDFVFKSFDAEYTLTTDDEGRSQLIIVETLVAVFPEFDQNRGIWRQLVDDYDGHPTDIEVVSVEDDAGNAREYEAEGEDEFLELTIAGDDYVHGEQIYVITYTQHNVTRFFAGTNAGTNADEFYWDTNGTGWAQPFGAVTATVILSPELMASLNGNVDAASGGEGEDGPATITETATGFHFGASELGPGQNLTFAIGFAPGTFEPRDDGFFSAPWPSISLAFTLVGLLITGAAVAVRLRRLRDAPGRGVIIPEYTEPKGANVFLSSLIIGRSAKATVAGILKLAVAGKLRILEVAGQKPHYQLQFITAAGADADETEFLHALFGNSLDPEEIRSLKKADEKATKRITAMMKRVSADATAFGYRRKIPFALIGTLILLGVLAAGAAFVFAVIALDQAHGGWLPGLFLAIALLSVGATVGLLVRTPLEAKGVELRDYLRGLEQYITLAEADRLRYLQSPQGAERKPVATDDRAAVVKLNEKLLPYAVLFGQEKEWAAELGRYYQELGTQPTWYAGQGLFNAALFSSSIGALSASTASAYSASSGGSSGGASSGGGGGGGGGGGV